MDSPEHPPEQIPAAASGSRWGIVVPVAVEEPSAVVPWVVGRAVEEVLAAGMALEEQP